MSNIRGLYDDKKDESSDDEKDSNNRYVGGIGARGGGSGLAVEPNADDAPSSRGNADSVFDLAEASAAAGVAASSGDDDEEIRRTITMYRNGFVVDDGPYRRLDDPANKEFLQFLARGQTPTELRGDGTTGGGNNNITVGLIDKRKEEYVEQFRSFSGAGQSLGSGAAAFASSAAATTSVGGTEQRAGVFDPSNLPLAPTLATTPATTTSIAVRMLDGKRKVVRIDPGATVAQLAACAVEASNTSIEVPFRMMTGFPPKPLLLPDQTIREAGLEGAQVQLQKA